MEAIPPTEALRYAGFWRRLAAWLIDMFIIMLVLLPIDVALGCFLGLLGAALSVEEAAIEGVAEATGLGVGLLIVWIYFAVLESSEWQSTVGKRALGIMVTDLAGERVRFGRATVRHFAKALSGLFAGMGFVMIGFSHQRQGLHDGLAKTLVVRGRADGRTWLRTSTGRSPACS